MSDTILTHETLESKSQEEENENKNKNENDKTRTPSKDEMEKENKTINQNNSDKTKELNDHLDEITDKSKSFEEQIKPLKKRFSKKNTIR